MNLYCHSYTHYNFAGMKSFTDLPYLLVGMQAKGIQIVAHSSSEKRWFLRDNTQFSSQIL
jgi:hypothetical protein